MNDHVDISLEMNGRQLDLRVPSQVTLARLKILLSEVFRDHGVRMPERWGLELAGKTIGLGQFDMLCDFPVGDGDVFTVVQVEE